MHNLTAILHHLVANIPDSPDQSRFLSFLNYVNSYRTVELSLPRMSGKSTALVQLSKSYFNPILIVPNSRLKEYISGSAQNCRIETYETLRRSLAERMFSLKLKDKCDIILIDEPDLVFNSQEDRNEILEALEANNFIDSKILLVGAGTPLNRKETLRIR